MYSLYVECTEQEAEFVCAELWERGAAGIQEETLAGARCGLRAWFEDPAGLMEQFERWGPRLEAEPETDWEEAARQAWPAIEVGSKWYLAPEWDESATPEGRVRLTIHPGQALGTGAHPATQLCLEAVERHVRPGARVLDVGTGSGILVAAACLLGAEAAAGCDIDHDQTREGLRNLRADGMRAGVFTGATRAVRNGWADVVVANINAAAHETLGAEYARVSRGLAVLSGFPERDAARVEAVCARAGLSRIERLERSEWVCLVFKKEEDS